MASTAADRRGVRVAVASGLLFAGLIVGLSELLVVLFESHLAGLLVIGVTLPPLVVWLLHRPHRGAPGDAPVRVGANRWSRRLVGARLLVALKAIALLAVVSLVIVPTRVINHGRLSWQMARHLASCLPAREAERDLVRIATDDDHVADLWALEALAECPSTEWERSGGMRAEFERRMRSGVTSERRHALELARRTAPGELLPAVIAELSEDANHGLRRIALRAMPELDGLPGSRERIALLLGHAAASSTERTVWAAFSALRDLAKSRGIDAPGWPAAVPELRWTSDEAATVRANHVAAWERALGVRRAPDTARVPTLEALLAHADAANRARARRHLAAIRAGEPRPADPW